MSWAPVRLRPVTLDDAAFLHRLANEPVLMEILGEEPSSLATWQEAIAAWLEDPDEQDFIVVSDRPRGWIGINGLASDDRVAWIKMLVLEPAAWSRGYASAALRDRLGWLAAQGYRRVRLWTDAANLRAQACYLRNGFAVETDVAPRAGGGRLSQRLRMGRPLGTGAP